MFQFATSTPYDSILLGFFSLPEFTHTRRKTFSRPGLTYLQFTYGSAAINSLGPLRRFGFYELW